MPDDRGMGRKRGAVTREAVPASWTDHGRQEGRVAGLFRDFGFLRAVDGRVLYFHRDAVVGGAWDDLTEGTEVTFVDEPDDDGPRVTTVSFSGRPRSIR